MGPFEYLINRMFKIAGWHLTLKEARLIDGYYHIFHWSPTQEAKWKEEAVAYLVRKHKFRKSVAKHQIELFNSNYGLRVKK